MEEYKIQILEEIATSLAIFTTKFLTTSQAARYINCSECFIVTNTRKGYLKSYLGCNGLLFKKTDLTDFIHNYTERMRMNGRSKTSSYTAVCDNQREINEPESNNEKEEE